MERACYDLLAVKTNVLYYGDNLDILRNHIPDESVDLVYLDPPFNSRRSYNVLFREETGAASEAQAKGRTLTSMGFPQWPVFSLNGSSE